MKVEIDIDTNGIMRAKGLGGSKKAQKFLASEVVRLADPYVPMQSGNLKNLHTIAADGSQIVYTQPYAHYQYYGKVMGPNFETKNGWRSGKAPKHYTGDDLTYHGAPMRGPQWVNRMMADKKNEIEKNVELYVKRG